MVGLPELRQYQLEIGRAIYASVWRRRGRLFTVEIARQGGKNELSAQLGVLLLLLASGKGGRMVKAAPTFNPQALVSLRRLQDRLDDGGFAGRWRLEGGNIVRLERAQQTFLSAEPTSNVVGATADVLLELDEAQDVERDKFLKEFRPMGATGNATTVLYGTPWDGGSLLETMSEENRELERKDGVRRDFRFDWEACRGVQPAVRAVRGVGARRGWARSTRCSGRSTGCCRSRRGRGCSIAGQLALLGGGHARLRGPLPGAGVRRGRRRGGGAVGGERRVEYGGGHATGSGRTEFGRRVRPFDKLRANGFVGRVRGLWGRPPSISLRAGFDRLRANGFEGRGGGGRGRACADGWAGRDGGDDWRGGESGDGWMRRRCGLWSTTGGRESRTMR